MLAGWESIIVGLAESMAAWQKVWQPTAGFLLMSPLG